MAPGRLAGFPATRRFEDTLGDGDGQTLTAAAGADKNQTRPSSAAIRLSIGGCVANNDASEAPVNGWTMNM